jgi:hypothetical protein
MLGEFGDLRLNFSSEGTETESAFTPSKIRNVKIAFRAGTDIKTSIKGLTFTKTT